MSAAATEARVLVFGEFCNGCMVQPRAVKPTQLVVAPSNLSERVLRLATLPANLVGAHAAACQCGRASVDDFWRMVADLEEEKAYQAREVDAGVARFSEAVKAGRVRVARGSQCIEMTARTTQEAHDMEQLAERDAIQACLSAVAEEFVQDVDDDASWQAPRCRVLGPVLTLSPQFMRVDDSALRVTELATFQHSWRSYAPEAKVASSYLRCAARDVWGRIRQRVRRRVIVVLYLRKSDPLRDTTDDTHYEKTWLRQLSEDDFLCLEQQLADLSWTRQEADGRVALPAGTRCTERVAPTPRIIVVSAGPVAHERLVDWARVVLRDCGVPMNDRDGVVDLRGELGLTMLRYTKEMVRIKNRLQSRIETAARAGPIRELLLSSCELTNVDVPLLWETIDAMLEDGVLGSEFLKLIELQCNYMYDATFVEFVRHLRGAFPAATIDLRDSALVRRADTRLRADELAEDVKILM